MGAPKKSVRTTARKYVDKNGKKKTVTVTPEEAMEIKKITDAYTDQSEAEYYVNKYLNELPLQAEEAVIQKNIDDNSKTGMNRGNMAYNKGGMGKSKTGHSDYRKGGMVYTTKGKK